MKMRLGELRRIIRKELMTESGQAPSEAPLGRYAFPGYRGRNNPSRNREENVPEEAYSEEDTAAERRLYADLDRYVNANIQMPSSSAALMKSFIEQGLYRQVFHPPESGVVYRGMRVTKGWLENAIRHAVVDDVGEAAGVDLVVSPRRGGVSSWTVDPTAAEDFSVSPVGAPEETRDGYAVVLTALVSDNPSSFVTGPGGFYGVRHLDNNANEEEVMGVGDIRVSGISWKKI